MITADTVPFSGSTERNRWITLNSRSVISTAFSSEAYVSALSSVLNLPVFATYLTKNGRDIAGLLSLQTSTGPLNRLVPAPVTPFSAFAADCLPSPAEIHAHTSWLDVLTEQLGGTYSTVDLMLPPQFRDVRALQWHGWTASPLYTFHLPLSGEHSGISGWSESTARTFRKHQNKYVLRSDLEDIPHVVRLLQSRYRRHGNRTPLSSEQMTSLASRIAAAGNAQCWTLRERNSDPNADSGQIIAGIVLLIHRETAVYWIAGSAPGPGMTVLIGSMLPELKREGITMLDFVGANTPAIAEFKRRFNPKLTPYFRVRYTRSRLLRVLQSARLAFRG